MLYQQGLTELIHSSLSEQVAYLLVVRASLLEASEVSENLTNDGNTASVLGTVAQVLKTTAHQVRGRTSQTDVLMSVLKFLSFSPLFDHHQLRRVG